MIPRRSLSLRRRFSTAVTIGIRREDPARIWERRCPLTPDAVAELVQKEGVRVLVQECERRVFATGDFLRAGAELHPTLSPAHILIGIKEPPLSSLLSCPLASSLFERSTLVPRTHLMFSHTAKGQEYNMPLLARFLAEDGQDAGDVLLPRLIDWELLTDRVGGKRLVGFGWMAGVAGVLESLSAVAQHHLTLGIASPFLYTPRPYTHASLASLRAALREIGAQVVKDGTPKGLGPFVIGLTGTGNVAKGCLSMLSELPIENISVKHLPALVGNPDTPLNKIYLVHAKPEDYFVHVSGNAYKREDYYSDPSGFRSIFCDSVAPYLTLFLNGAGWAPGFPRLMTNAQLIRALETARSVRGRARGECIGDISCDLEGGLEFLTRATTLSDPVYHVRPATHLSAVKVMAVDILPASVPREASERFSEAVMPYVRAIIRGYQRAGMEDVRQGQVDKGMAVSEEEERLRDVLERATIARDGRLVPRFAWLKARVDKWRTERGQGTTVAQATSMRPGGRRKKVLLLGSGMVAGPAVDEFAKRPDVDLMVASKFLKEARHLTRHHANAQATEIDVSTRRAEAEELVQAADLVISLLPVPFHPIIAEMCIRHQKHLVTASYISPAMQALHERALAADVLLLNEIGLDPGIDHCSAHMMLQRLAREGKRVVAFTSFCGGLPAPECAEGVPLGYKFSWSPRGVLSAASNAASFRLLGKDWTIPGEDLLKVYFPDVPVSNVLRLEGLANRDSLSYAETYNLGPADEMRTLLRGTLRYPGFAELMYAFKSIGLLCDTKNITIDNWSSLASVALENRLETQIYRDRASFVSALADAVPPGSERLEATLGALDWLSQPPSLPDVPKSPATPIDLFATLLAHKLRYAPHERDLVVLTHEVAAIADAPSGMSPPMVHTIHEEEIHTASLVVYGTSEASAMARCVGLPLAFAAMQVLDGAVAVRGVAGPTDESVYTAVLRKLEEAGLGLKESMRRGYGIERILETGVERMRTNGSILSEH